MQLSYRQVVRFALIHQITAFQRVVLVLPLMLAMALSSINPVWGQQEVSVDQFTGTANVSIPLASLEIKSIPLGLSLNYNANGLNANDQGAPVGAGWGLGGIPIISRQVRGLPDDYRPCSASAGQNCRFPSDPQRYGWLTPEAQAHAQSVNSSWAQVSYPLAANAGSCANLQEQQALGIVSAFEGQRPVENPVPSTMWDSEPDIFSYSVPGHAGRFVFDNTGHVRTIPFDPITVTYDNSRTDSLGTCIHSFTISTAEGNTYQFNEYDITHKKTNKYRDIPSPNGGAMSHQLAAPTIFQREFYYYRLDASIVYAAAWHITAMQNPAGEHIDFSYTNNRFWDTQTAWEPSAVTLPSLNGRIPEYSWTIQQNNATLTKITSPTAFIRFWQDDTVSYIQPGGTYITKVISGYRTSRGETTVKTVDLDLYQARKGECPITWEWPNNQGEAIDFLSYMSINYQRAFLHAIRINSECGNPLTYSFKYHSSNSIIPPVGGSYKDYWGYLRFDSDAAWSGDFGMGPVLYDYSGVLASQTVPGPLFRLFPAPGIPLIGTSRYSAIPAAGEVSLFNNAPAPAGETNFQRSTLLGTLEEIRLPAGGRITLEYEPHQFYDPAIETLNPANNYTGPGVRVHAVAYTDDMGGVTQRREYRYTATDGKSSGRLLWLPVFGFRRPFATDNIFLANDVAIHPYESRAIGYGRVTEVVSGRGQTVTSFAVDGAAHEVAANPSGATGSAPNSHLPSWHRTTVAPARSTIALVRHSRLPMPLIMTTILLPPVPITIFGEEKS